VGVGDGPIGKNSGRLHLKPPKPHQGIKRRARRHTREFREVETDQALLIVFSWGTHHVPGDQQAVATFAQGENIQFFGYELAVSGTNQITGALHSVIL